MLLWRGIARFVSQNPRYRLLFGPVSITRDYHAISRQLIVAYLERDDYRSDLRRLVRPINPVKRRPGKGEANRAVTFLRDLRDLSDFISEIERDEKGIPILLKHYIRLGAKILGFNIDHKFKDVIDALILVDLAQADRRLLDRHMGKEAAAEFLGHHSMGKIAYCA